MMPEEFVLNNKLLAAALNYASLGLRVFPIHGINRTGSCTCGKPDCKKPGKHPHIKDNLQAATADSEQITKWWSKWPTANIGIATGPASGVFVLDQDGSEGEAALNALEQTHGPLAVTWRSETGRGQHVYFLYPEGTAIKSSSGKIGTGLDIRGAKASVVAPPSRHHSGRRYEWIASPESAPLADAPEWLIQAATDDERPANHSTVASNQDLAQVLNGLPHGQRDDSINRYVWSRLGRGMSVDEVKVLVLEAAKNCNPPLDEAEALEKVDRALAKLKHEQNFNLTDMGNAQRLANLFGNRIHFSKHLGWLVYDGRRWAADNESRVQWFAKETVRQLYAEASLEADEDRRKALAALAMKCESASRIAAMVQLLPSEPGISVTHEMFDRDKMLLNVANGTLDLHSGQLRAHSPSDLITKLALVEYNPEAKCEGWEKFLLEIMDGNHELVSFLQRLLGYGLTGETKEQVWIFLWGKGENGKGTLLAAVANVLGDYAVNTPAETFLETSGGSIRNDLARLRGARLVTASEPMGKKFDPAVLKSFTGQDPITARFLHREFFEYLPEGKLFFSANHRPDIRDTSHGFWRRVILVPFNRVFSGAEKDDSLRERLQAEASGILNWLIQGCLDWQASGLNAPEDIRLAVADYRSETDVLADFLDSCCETGPGQTVTVKDLFDSYKTYCEDKSVRKALSKQKFNEDLLARPYIKRDRIGIARIHTWIGIGLKGEASQDQSCSSCHLEGEPCPKGRESKNPATCEYYGAYN
ncbi:MAG: phage/plasmid primase, P4 family [Desulfomonilaceae bacterium]